MSLTQHLAALFAEHGIPVLRRDDWLVPDGTIGPHVRMFVTPYEVTANGASVRLDVEVAVSDKHRVLESFGGIGTSTTEAASDAFDNFCKGSFHVILAAFYGYSDPEQVTQERWSLSGVDYDVVIGNYCVRSFEGKGTPIPEETFSTLERLIRGLEGTEDLYWVRLFYGNQNDRTQLTEVLLNNVEWDLAKEAIAALPWERRPWIYSARLFLVLCRVGDAVAREKIN
ncbi:MAG TPA: DUF6348 family protein [Pyrinomonadaceae bacterium]|nr:DUF6348 family protein [Pyrinomonadaceae bacterium]